MALTTSVNSVSSNTCCRAQNVCSFSELQRKSRIELRLDFGNVKEQRSSWTSREELFQELRAHNSSDWRAFGVDTAPRVTPTARKTFSARAGSTLLELAPKENPQKSLNYDLPIFDSRKNSPVDLVVVGGGPSGLAVAQQVSAAGLQVLCIDPEPRSVWPNNYGVWVDEFEAMDLLDCLDYTWSSAVVHLDDATRKTLNRPYGRVNRTRLKSKMMEQCLANGVQFYQSKVKHVTHSRDRSFVQCDDESMIETVVVLDATGHSRRLVRYAFQPWLSNCLWDSCGGGLASVGPRQDAVYGLAGFVSGKHVPRARK